VYRARPNYLRLWAIALSILLLIGGLFLAFPQASPDGAVLTRAAILLFVMTAGILAVRHIKMREFLRILAAWGIIVAGISGVYWLTVKAEDSHILTSLAATPKATDGGAYVVRKARDGHFWLRAELNGVPVNLMVDTGATNLVLSRSDAAKIGFDPDQLDYGLRAKTANGTVWFAEAMVDTLRMGSTEQRSVPVTINKGAMPGSLLGMSVLNTFSSVEFRGDRLILRP